MRKKASAAVARLQIDRQLSRDARLVALRLGYDSTSEFVAYLLAEVVAGNSLRTLRRRA